jgi:uncharacterized protein (DUF1697 family)
MKGPCVALIRGINVGKNKQVAMAELRAACERIGFHGVRTLLNSGNVVFSTALSPRAAAAKLERALEKEIRVPARVLVLTAAEIDATVAKNSLLRRATNPSRLFVGFLWEPVAALEVMRRQHWGENALALGPQAAYLWCPDGFDSPLVKAFHRAVGTGVTVRSWATVQKLQAAVRADRAPAASKKKSPPRRAARRLER